MLFDARPKDNRRDLYDAEAELKSLLSAIKKGTPLLNIVGLRRTGKTSLLLTALSLMPSPYMILDLRVLAAKPYATKKDLIEEIEGSLNDFYKTHLTTGKKIFNWLKRVRGVGVSPAGININWGGKESADLASLFDELNNWAKGEGKRMIVAFDEAQELKKVAGIDVAKLLAHVYDYCRNITVILTGSAIGLLYEFLATHDPKAPLYGRHLTEIQLGRLSEKMARDFLQRGFKQAKMKIRAEILDLAVKRLDGIIGWLTLFGNVCVKAGKISEDAITQTMEIGQTLAKQEFENFLKGRDVARPRYEAIVQHLSRGPSSWSAIKRTVEAMEGKAANDRNVTELLTNLVKAGFVEKEGKSYVMTDPMLVEAVKQS